MKISIKKIIAISITATLAASLFATTVSAGWKQEANKNWSYYYDTKTFAQNKFEKINDQWYYFADKGIMKTGWVFSAGAWYFMKPNGAMATGWLQQNNKWYYLAENGKMENNGWRWTNGKCYYFYKDGSMAVNTTIEGSAVDGKGAWIKPTPVVPEKPPVVPETPTVDPNYYSNYPAIPDFGKHFNLKLINTGKRNSLALYYYKGTTIQTAKETTKEYGDLLQSQGFSKESNTPLNKTYKKTVDKKSYVVTVDYMTSDRTYVIACDIPGSVPIVTGPGPVIPSKIPVDVAIYNKGVPDFGKMKNIEPLVQENYQHGFSYQYRTTLEKAKDYEAKLLLYGFSKVVPTDEGDIEEAEKNNSTTFKSDRRDPAVTTSYDKTNRIYTIICW